MELRTRIWKRRFVDPARRAVKRRLVALRALLRPADYGEVLKRLDRLEENERKLLMRLHPEAAAARDQLAQLAAAELRLDTENGEAGVLLWLFRELGTTDRRAVEFGIGRVRKCNSTNLLRSFGWSALLIDGDPSLVEAARAFHEAGDPASVRRLVAVESWVTPENVDDLIERHGFSGEIDLLSLDVDGNDYWIWQKLERCRPRVMVVEYNASFGPDARVSTPYREGFDRYSDHPLGWFHGASLAAFESLGRSKGYRLIGCETKGHNAFFVRDDVAEGHLQAVASKTAFYPDARRLKVASQAAQEESLAALPCVEV